MIGGDFEDALMLGVGRFNGRRIDVARREPFRLQTDPTIAALLAVLLEHVFVAARHSKSVSMGNVFCRLLKKCSTVSRLEGNSIFVLT